MKNFLGFLLVLTMSASEKPFLVGFDPHHFGPIAAQNTQFSIIVGRTEATPATLTLQFVVEYELFKNLGNSVWTAVTPVQTVEVLGASEKEGVLFEYTPKSIIRLSAGTYRIRFAVKGSDVPPPPFVFYVVAVSGPTQ
jgi:hypothetical protein